MTCKSQIYNIGFGRQLGGDYFPLLYLETWINFGYGYPYQGGY